jgi:prepilin-type N-terminal cleavage/methylation domain-containing protein/prepilin-type processing-associated H-X9-DG protein
MQYTRRMMRRAFTLIEMVVVISILALLLALFAPAMDNVHRQAWSVACQHNIHQMQVALLAFEAQNQSFPYGFDRRRPSPYPDTPEIYPGSATFDSPGWWWFNYAEVQVTAPSAGKRRGMLACPARHLEDPWLERDNLFGNYGVNRALCSSNPNGTSSGLPNKTVGERSPFKPTYLRPPGSSLDLSRPDSTLLVCDSGYALICWWHAVAKPPVTLGNSYGGDLAYVPGLDINRDHLVQPGQIVDAIGGRHPKKTVNVGFADGSLRRKKAQDLLVTKTDPNTYTNKTPLWEPR